MIHAFYDSHVHTLHSEDSQQPIDPICQTALEKGLAGITITDHVDMWFLEQFNTLPEIKASIADARAAAARYEGRLKVFCGVEMGESQDDPQSTEKILGLTNYDVVLGSVHSVQFPGWEGQAYSWIDFSESSMSEAQVMKFMDTYFHKLLHMAQYEDFDSLTHLTCPLRYINGKYHRNISVDSFRDIIREVLSTVIKRKKALELNTSGIQSFYGDFLPSREILAEYYSMGGRLITLASDAHTADRVGNAFPEAKKLLKDIGFQGYYYYDQRKPQFVSWDA